MPTLDDRRPPRTGTSTACPGAGLYARVADGCPGVPRVQALLRGTPTIRVVTGSEAAARVAAIRAGTSDHPIGTVEELSPARISGWAFDPNDKQASLSIHVYVDGVGHRAGQTTVVRSDVNRVHHLTGAHGFSWRLPYRWFDGRNHTVDVYAINVGSGRNVRIGSRS